MATQFRACVIALLLSLLPATAFSDYCWKDSYGRGAGTIPEGCPDGHENDAGLCYEKCRAGYTGAGPVCWAHEYGRGAGYITHSKCTHAYPNGCEKYGLLYYPHCNEGYEHSGCCLCKTKGPLSYTRGAGKIPETCPAEKQNDAGLCYKACKSGYHGVGPVCWMSCPAGMVNCGMGCASSKDECASNTIGQVTSSLSLIANIATLGASGEEENAAMEAEKTGLRKVWADVQESEIYQTFDNMKTKASTAALTYNQTRQFVDFVKGRSDDLSAFDPTGIANVVNAFKHPLCKP